MAYVRLGGCLSDLLVEKSFVSLAADRIVGKNNLGPNIPGKTNLVAGWGGGSMLVVVPPYPFPWRQDHGVSSSWARPVT